VISHGGLNSPKESHWLATSLVSHFLIEFSQRGDGFASFSRIGCVNHQIQELFFDTVCDAARRHIPQLSHAIRQVDPVTALSIQPYMTAVQAPNAISIFHLAFQSLAHDHVLSL
jgi:hypothetical protein